MAVRDGGAEGEEEDMRDEGKQGGGADRGCSQPSQCVGAVQDKAGWAAALQQRTERTGGLDELSPGLLTTCVTPPHSSPSASCLTTTARVLFLEADAAPHLFHSPQRVML